MTDPRETNKIAYLKTGLGLGLGMSVACALFARGREDIMRAADRDENFATTLRDLIAGAAHTDALTNGGTPESFAALVDALIAKRPLQ